MGWQIPICQKERRPLKNKYALRHLPNRSLAIFAGFQTRR